MPLSSEQRQRVFDAISSGRLPLIPPQKMYAGYGSGRPCNGCDQQIGATEIEYEAQFEDGRIYYLHLGCAALLEGGRRRRMAAAVEDARIIREQSQATREKARLSAKDSAQLRDHADVLARESEVAREKARQVKRGEQQGQ